MQMIIQLYLVAAYLLACSYLTPNALHSTHYIISMLSLYTCSKGITHNHKTRFQIHNNNTHHSKVLSPMAIKGILLRKYTLHNKDTLLKTHIKVNKSKSVNLKFFYLTDSPPPYYYLLLQQQPYLIDTTAVPVTQQQSVSLTIIFIDYKLYSNSLMLLLYNHNQLQ